jgi:hypothetical protein
MTPVRGVFRPTTDGRVGLNSEASLWIQDPSRDQGFNHFPRLNATKLRAIVTSELAILVAVLRQDTPSRRGEGGRAGSLRRPLAHGTTCLSDPQKPAGR